MKTRPRKRKNIVTEKKKRRCRGKTPDGNRCKKPALPGEFYCHAHHPDRKEQRIENSRKGGQVTRRPQLPERRELTVQKARQLLSAASEMLVAGTMSSSVARSLAYLLQTDKILQEHGEIMQRLEKLESEG